MVVGKAWIGLPRLNFRRSTAILVTANCFGRQEVAEGHTPREMCLETLCYICAFWLLSGASSIESVDGVGG